MRQPKLGDIVEVTWIDTHAPIKEGAWLSVKKYQRFKIGVCKIRSVGYYASRNKKYLHIMGDLNSKVSVSRVMNIVKKCVIKIKILK